MEENGFYVRKDNTNIHKTMYENANTDSLQYIIVNAVIYVSLTNSNTTQKR